MGVARRKEHRAAAAAFLFAVAVLGVLAGGAVVRAFEDGTAVYIVTMKQAPVFHRRLNLEKFGSSRVANAAGSGGGGGGGGAGDTPSTSVLRKPRNGSPKPMNYGSYLTRLQNLLLKRMLRGEHYIKLYSYRYLVNGFAIVITPQQADKLSRRKEVANVMLDYSVRTATTHTPEFLGLPQGAWVQEGGPQFAGQGVVVGLIDTGIDPTHPSFADDLSTDSYPVPAHYSGICEVTNDFPSGSCNRKLVGARHFAASAITRGVFNASKDLASPSDSDGHGTHTASIAAGNHGIPVVVAGHQLGNASGMAPRAHIAVYKALYKSFGGFAADVVAAIDQAAEDNVDIISLSITPNRRPPGLATFFNPIDMALLSAVKAGIFVVQAAGNTGPSPKSMSSYSPWIFTVGASAHDRVYSNYVVLGNNLTIQGVGLAPGTDGDCMYTLIAAPHALKNNTATPTEMSLGECQYSSRLDADLIRGKILVCSYSIRFVLGLSSVKQALDTANNVSAAGVIFYLDPFVLGFQLNPTPMHMPGLIIPSSDDSKVFLTYYNDSLVRDGTSGQIVSFGGVAKILGGLNPNFGNSAPKVMFYSARGPDPEDNSLSNADILKPNLVAPGSSIWGAWSSLGLDSAEFAGESFAMLSGTSMAAPHVAGLAALIKQKFPSFNPAAIASALSTTTTLSDRQGKPIMAQRTYSNPDSTQSPATAFDMGNGFVNATAALDPGIIFDCGYNDFFSFLCGINGSGPVVTNYTGNSCADSTMTGADLNLPSITIAVLNQTRTITRTVTNVAADESYAVSYSAPYGTVVSVAPTQFLIPSGQKQLVTFVVNATMNSSTASFGNVGFYGDKGHRAIIPFSVISKVVYSSRSPKTSPTGSHPCSATGNLARTPRAGASRRTRYRRSGYRLFPGISPAAVSGPVSAPAPARSCKPSKVFAGLPHRRRPLFLGTRRARIRCVKDDSLHFDPSKIEPPPYSSYYDSTSGQLEPASGARASIPGKEYWPEGTAARVRAARAPAPVEESAGAPSFGTKPGSRRRGYKEQVTSASGTEGAQTDDGKDDGEPVVAIVDSGDDASEEPKDSADEYVIYETPEEEELSEYDMDKMMGRPHPFIDPAKAMSLGEPKTSEELWWNWRRKSQKEEMWSRWQRRRPDVDTVFAKAMAETGQIKIFGDHPSRTEAALAKTRRHLYKEERLEAEQRRLEEIGPIAYYSEWVEAYKNKDTSREAIQKHFEETGEDENAQLIKMFQHQTAGEYRIMMGTDVRIQRDPLAMRMREDQIKQIWGGDPVYPTINYVQDPEEVIDYRGPEFHEPTAEVVPYLMEHGIMITKEELFARLNEERDDVNQDITYVPEVKDPMATAVDIGDHSYNEDSDDEDEDVDKAAAQPESLEDEEDDGDNADEVEEKVSENWSVLKSTGQAEKPMEKSKKGEMSLKEAIDDSENLTDFLMDFEQDE